MKSTFVYISIIISLIFVSWKLGYRLYQEHQSTVRLTDDLKASQQENEYFKSKNGDQAVKIQSLELTVQELKKISPAIIHDLKNLYVPPRLLNNYTKLVTESGFHVSAPLKDTLISKKENRFTDIFNEADKAFREAADIASKEANEKVKMFDYSDIWYSVKGIIKSDTAELNIKSRDTVTAVNSLSRRPNKFLCIRYGRRHPECTISNKNPHNKITIIKSIAIKK